MLRVGIVGLLQESNTFIPGRTTLDHFRDDLLLRGEEVRRRMAAAPHEVGGFFEGLDAHGIQAVPLFLTRALPYGVIEAGTFDVLVREMLGAITDAGDLDGILAAPHGATVSENHPDADGFWLSEVRNLVGPEIPFVATIDPHANLSERMVRATDAIIAYATNPHLDQRETGLAAADLIARALRGEIRPVQEASFPPLAINI
ncbi:MAG: M81 family metallopeptidase, partial [Rhodothermia bacterium]